jgi:hypothetical protein
MNPDHGTYRLSYTPPAPDGYEEYPSIAIEMSTSGDANVDQMLRFYEAFLAASGYELKGDLQVAETPDFSSSAFGAGQPVPYVGSIGQDVISFG